MIIGEKMASRFFTVGCIAFSVIAGSFVVREAALAQQIAVEEIVVTSRKREENLQTVPLAITAFSAETLERAAITSLSDVAHATPGLTFVQFGEGRLALPVVRGLTPVAMGENNVPVFLDGIFLSNRNTLDLEMLDLERIEVVKGPQSALYGQNAFAGAINYVTKKPGDEFEAYLQGGVGAHEYYQAKGAVSGPLFKDKLFARLAVGVRNHDGTFENAAEQDNRVQGRRNIAASGTFLAPLTDDLEATLSIYYNDFEYDPDARFILENQCGNNGFGGFTHFCGELSSRDPVDLSPEGEGNNGNTLIAGLKLEYELTDEITITSITAYSDTENQQFQDFDFTSGGVPFTALNAMTGMSRTVLSNAWIGQGDGGNEDIAQELRISYRGERFQAIAGGYYIHTKQDVMTTGGVDSSVLNPGEMFIGFIPALFGTPDPKNQGILSTVNFNVTETNAAFGQFDFDITESLRFSAGVRFTDEYKSVNSVLSFTRPGTGFRSDRFKFWTPQFSLDYMLTDDAMVYASVARGARSGGFNANFAADVPEEATFEPETNWTYEVGAKSTWFDGRLTVNASAFLVDWSNLQIQSQSASELATTIFSVTRNTGNAQSKGFEVAASAALSENFNFGLGYSLADATFDDGSIDLGNRFICGVDASICTLTELPGIGAAVPDVSGNRIPRSSKHTFAGNSTITFPLAGDWSVYLRGDVFYRSRLFSTSQNLQWAPGFWMVNARLAVENEQYELALWAENLFDEEWVANTTTQPRFHSFARLTDVVPGDGRIWGVTATARF